MVEEEIRERLRTFCNYFLQGQWKILRHSVSTSRKPSLFQLSCECSNPFGLFERKVIAVPTKENKSCLKRKTFNPPSLSPVYFRMVLP